MATTTTRLTIDDYERLPQEQAENHELVDGELVPVAGNTPEHLDIQDFLVELLRPFARERGLGKVFTELEYDFNGNAHAPDLSFFGLSKLPFLDRRKRVQRFVPDLAIEIVSTNDTWISLMERKERYRTCGTDEVWIISPPDREIFIFSSRGDRILRSDMELSTDLLPDFRIPVHQLFEDAIR